MTRRIKGVRGPTWKRRPSRDPWERVRIGVLLVLLVVVIGTIGYDILGLSTFDALYQTVITITTVGFEEVGNEAAESGSYRAFTLVLVVLGTGAVLYTLSLLVDTLIEGSLNNELRRRRMMRDIEKLEGHVIIAGWGRMGHAIARSVGRSGKDIVIIDREAVDDLADHAVVVGEATDDHVLRQAGIERAATLIAALSGDADNLFVTLSARSIRPDLFIVTRTTDQKNEPKFYQAGADRVVNPHEIGGSRMAALAMQPHAAEFLDEVLHDDSHDVAVQEINIVSTSPMIGKQLLDLVYETGHRPLVIAIRSEDGRYHTNPAPSTRLRSHEVIIALGSTEDLRALRAQVAGH